MRNQEIEVSSLIIIKHYFLGIRQLNYPMYDKGFKEKDLELFVKLADTMENLTDFNEFLYSYLQDLKEIVWSVPREGYSLTVQEMLDFMKEELQKIE